jgi:hypothetical protein
MSRNSLHSNFSHARETKRFEFVLPAYNRSLLKRLIQEPFMNMKFAAAIALFAAIPALAQAQEGGNAPKPSKADVQKLVQSIQSDKAKTQQYCAMMKLYDQAAEAEEKKDNKKVEDLTKQADDAGKNLGPDYQKVMAGLQQVDPSSPEGQELSAALDPLDNSCGGDAPKK